jgi:TPR repeat protein
VDKTILQENFSLFGDRPQLLCRDCYQVKAIVPEPFFVHFVQAAKGNHIDISEAAARPLLDLCNEFGFEPLREACERVLHQSQSIPKSSADDLEERVSRQETELEILHGKIAELRGLISVPNSSTYLLEELVSRQGMELETLHSEIALLRQSISQIRETQGQGEFSRLKSSLETDIAVFRRQIELKVVRLRQHFAHYVSDLRTQFTTDQAVRRISQQRDLDLIERRFASVTAEVSNLRTRFDHRLSSLATEGSTLRRELNDHCDWRRRFLNTYQSQFSSLSADVSKLRERLDGEQLYRRGQEYLFGDHDFHKSPVLGLSLLERSASLGHGDAAYCCGRRLPPDQPRLNYFSISARDNNSFGQSAYGRALLYGEGIPKDPSMAARYFKLSADQCNPKGQCYYGRVLYDGLGVPQDYAESARYYTMSADQGSRFGQYNYAWVLKHGDGVQKDVAEALKYYRLSAEQGYDLAQNCLGWIIKKGRAVEQDLDEAARYFKMSADQGYAQGRYNYGMALLNGEGVKTDVAEAAKYLKLAADQGNSCAQYNYGVLLRCGRGVSKDVGEGTRYIRLAADQGNPEARTDLGI